MDTATAHEPKAWEIPGNSGGGPRERLMFSASHQGRVQLDDGAVHDLPLGTSMVIALPRREANDYYAEIKGKRHVSGVGETKDGAFLAALAKAA